jgi:hypothetical protein
MSSRVKENMKKLIHKLRHKLRKQKDDLPPSSRITSDTMAQHRERILAGGRRFKYPIQYARHKLVINAIIISVSALIVVLVVGWWQLYKAQNTSQFMYNVTKVLPIPVAKIDGQYVLYSDYLLKYLSSAHYLEQKEQIGLNTDNGKRQIEYIKQQSMQDAIADAYALKLSKSLNVSISDSELEAFLKEQRQSSDGEISEQTYDAVILDYYGWSPAEYRHVTKNKLLRQKVAYAMDKTALEAVGIIESTLKTDPKADFKTLATNISSIPGKKAEYGVSGLVPKTNQDGGLAIEAAKLKESQTSAVIKSTTGEGYYFVRLLVINATHVNYEYIKISLTDFTKALDSVVCGQKQSQKVHIYIDEKISDLFCKQKT